MSFPSGGGKPPSKNDDFDDEEEDDDDVGSAKPGSFSSGPGRPSIGSQFPNLGGSRQGAPGAPGGSSGSGGSGSSGPPNPPRQSTFGGSPTNLPGSRPGGAPPASAGSGSSPFGPRSTPGKPEDPKPADKDSGPRPGGGLFPPRGTPDSGGDKGKNDPKAAAPAGNRDQNKDAGKKDDKADKGDKGGGRGGFFGRIGIGGGRKQDDDPKAAAPKADPAKSGGSGQPFGGARPASGAPGGGGGPTTSPAGGSAKPIGTAFPPSSQAKPAANKDAGKGGGKDGGRAAGGVSGLFSRIRRSPPPDPDAPAKPKGTTDATKGADSGGRRNPIAGIFNRTPAQPAPTKGDAAGAGKKVPTAAPAARIEGKTAKPLDKKDTKVQVKVTWSRDRQLDLIGIALVAVAAIIFFGIISPAAPDGQDAFITGVVVRILGQFFGNGKYVLWVPALVVGGWLIVRHFGDRPPVLEYIRAIGWVLVFLALVVTFQIIEMFQPAVPNLTILARRSATAAAAGYGGGLVGDKIYMVLMQISGNDYITFVIVIAWWVIALMLAFEITMAEISQYVQSLFLWVAGVRTGFGDSRSRARAARELRLEEQQKQKAALTVTAPGAPGGALAAGAKGKPLSLAGPAAPPPAPDAALNAPAMETQAAAALPALAGAPAPGGGRSAVGLFGRGGGPTKDSAAGTPPTPPAAADKPSTPGIFTSNPAKASDGGRPADPPPTPPDAPARPRFGNIFGGKPADTAPAAAAASAAPSAGPRPESSAAPSAVTATGSDSKAVPAPPSRPGLFSRGAQPAATPAQTPAPAKPSIGLSGPTRPDADPSGTGDPKAPGDSDSAARVGAPAPAPVGAAPVAAKSAGLPIFGKGPTVARAPAANPADKPADEPADKPRGSVFGLFGRGGGDASKAPDPGGPSAPKPADKGAPTPAPGAAADKTTGGAPGLASNPAPAPVGGSTPASSTASSAAPASVGARPSAPNRLFGGGSAAPAPVAASASPDLNATPKPAPKPGLDLPIEITPPRTGPSSMAASRVGASPMSSGPGVGSGASNGGSAGNPAAPGSFSSGRPARTGPIIIEPAPSTGDTSKVSPTAPMKPVTAPPTADQPATSTPAEPRSTNNARPPSPFGTITSTEPGSPFRTGDALTRNGDNKPAPDADDDETVRDTPPDSAKPLVAAASAKPASPSFGSGFSRSEPLAPISERGPVAAPADKPEPALARDAGPAATSAGSPPPGGPPAADRLGPDAGALDRPKPPTADLNAASKPDPVDDEAEDDDPLTMQPARPKFGLPAAGMPAPTGSGFSSAPKPPGTGLFGGPRTSTMPATPATPSVFGGAKPPGRPDPLGGARPAFGAKPPPEPEDAEEDDEPLDDLDLKPATPKSPASALPPFGRPATPSPFAPRPAPKIGPTIPLGDDEPDPDADLDDLEEADDGDALMAHAPKPANVTPGAGVGRPTLAEPEDEDALLAKKDADSSDDEVQYVPLDDAPPPRPVPSPSTSGGGILSGSSSSRPGTPPPSAIPRSPGSPNPLGSVGPGSPRPFSGISGVAQPTIKRADGDPQRPAPLPPAADAPKVPDRPTLPPAEQPAANLANAPRTPPPPPAPPPAAVEKKPEVPPASAPEPADGNDLNGTITRSKPPAVWELPSYTTVLEKGSEQIADQEYLKERARIIEETLQSFGAPGKIVEVNSGPVITQFGVEPDYLVSRQGKKTRVKVSSIAKLDADLALALAARTIRIEAPVPGKGYVGIEVPNTKTTLVSLRDIMDEPVYQRIKSSLRIALGRSVDGHPIVADLTSMPHLLIAGTTGSGKSVCVNAIISTLLLENTPEDLRFIMVDPKRVELTGYNGIPHLVEGTQVVVDLERIVGVLKWVTREMEERYKRFAQAGARNIVDFNQRTAATGQKIPYLVVVIDELADLMMLAPEETEKTLARLAQMARATGIHLIVSTQRPSVDVVTGLIKANFPARISFAVASSVDSRVILDQPGAEKLLGRGDMLYQAPDAAAPVRIQGVYLSDPEINRIVQFWKTQKPARPQANTPPNPGLAPANRGVFNVGTTADPIKSPAEKFGLAVNTGSGSRTPAPAPATPPTGAPKLFDKEPPMARPPITTPTDGTTEDEDELYEEAVKLYKESGGKVGIQLLQRRLRVGYMRASRLIDMMKQHGLNVDNKPGTPEETLDEV